MISLIILVLSLFLVVRAADWFLVSAEKVGVALKLSPFILGMVIVGFGTSLPELATSLAAVSDNVHNVTLPNIIGSNLVNILVTVGIVSFLIGSIRFEKDLIDLDLPLLFGSTVLFVLLVSDGVLSFGEAILLFGGFLGYLLYALLHKEGKEFERGLISVVVALARSGLRKPMVLARTLKISWMVSLALSLALLAGGSRLAVDSAIAISQEFDILVDVVSFFAIAIGTSLPELVVSLKAVKQGQGDIALGNIIGSSIFNLLLIGGIAGMVTTQVIHPALITWLVLSLGISTLFLTLSSITKRIYAWEGLFYMLVYIAISLKVFQLSNI